MNAGRFKRIVESLAIDVPVLRAEALPGGGVRFFLYGGRIVETAGDGEHPAEAEGGVEQPALASSRGGQRRQPPGKGAAAAGSRKAVPGEQSTSAGRQAAAPGRQR